MSEYDEHKELEESILGSIEKMLAAQFKIMAMEIKADNAALLQDIRDQITGVDRRVDGLEAASKQCMSRTDRLFERYDGISARLKSVEAASQSNKEELHHVHELQRSNTEDLKAATEAVLQMRTLVRFGGALIGALSALGSISGLIAVLR